MEELKKCPFCGGEAKLTKRTECIGHGDYILCVTVGCASCGGAMTSDGYDKESVLVEEAVNSWNTRKPVERILERLEDAKKNICGSYNYKTPLLENPSHKIAFNNGIDKAIEIIKEEVG